MLRYLARRLMQLIPTLLGISLLVFITMRIVPGDPARLVAGPEASEDVVISIRSQLGLDKPLITQYISFLSGAVRLDLGRSIRSNQNVTTILAEKLPATLEIAVSSIVLATVVGLLTGIVAGVWPNSVFDTASMAVASLGISMPSFWMGMMLIWLFSIRLGMLPVAGRGSFAHLILPTVTIGAQSTAIIARMTRSSLIEVMRLDYIRTAASKGVPPNRIVMKHALKNALIPTITVVGLQFGGLLAGSIVTETVFNWPGMGLMLVNAIAYRDYPVVQGAVILFGVMFAITNLIVDLCYALVDPRIRYR